MYKLFEIGYFSVSLAYTECSDWLSPLTKYVNMFSEL